MEPIRHFADAWMPLFGIHTLEISAFILLVWAADQFLRLDTRLRYALYLLALAKVFIPPVFLLPAPPPVSMMAPLEPLSVQPSDFDLPAPATVAEQAVHVSHLSLSLLFLGLWAASVLIMAALTVHQNLALRRRLSRAAPLTRPLLPSETEKGRTGEPENQPSPRLTVFATPLPRVGEGKPSEARRGEGLFSLRVFSVGTISAPVLVGFRYPRLYLPEGWAAWPDDQLRGILAHELAHLRARDPWVLVLQTLALVLFGLNPLVWVLYARLTYLRELRCDEAAIEQTGIDPVDYSRLLYAFVENQARRPRLTVTGTYFLENHRAILRRLQHVLNFEEGAMKFRKWWHYLAPALLGLAILPLSIQGREKPSDIAETIISQERQPMPVEKLFSEEQNPAPVEKAKAESQSREHREERSVVLDSTGVPSRPTEAHTGFIISPASAKISLDFRVVPIKLKAASGDSVIVEKLPVLAKPHLPPYPEKALRDSLEGIIRFHILIGKDGKTHQVEAFTGDEMFKQAATEAALSSVWKPAIYKGEPVSVWIDSYAAFRIKNLRMRLIAESGDSITVEEPPRAVKPGVPPKGSPKWTQAEFREALRNSPERSRGTISVQLRVLVGADGKTHRAEVIEGPEGFREAALEEIMGATWEPAISQGKPVGVWIKYPFGFHTMYKNLVVKGESGDTVVVDQGALPFQMSKPVYPAAALKDSIEGVVYLNVLVGEDGRVKQVEVIRGEEVFKQAAVDAIKAATWRPATIDDKPVSVWISYTFPFGIRKGVPPSPDAFVPVDEQPRPIVHPKPAYPKSARRDSLEGVVYLKILVGKDGGVEGVEAHKVVAERGGEELFKQAAIESAKESVWLPAVHKGMPVSVWVAYPIRFTLKDGGLPWGRMPQGWLGVNMQDVTDETASRLGLKSKEGVMVSDVMGGSPAQKAGVRMGDVIVAVDGKSIKDSNALLNAISAMDPGKTAVLKVVRDKKEMTVPVTLGERPGDGPPPGARILEPGGGQSPKR